jgi:hypothetical protein
MNNKDNVGDNDYTSFKINVDHICDSCNNTIKYAEFIPLEFNDHAILNGIDKIIYSGENLIVFDKRQRQVIIFDAVGKFHAKIQKYGKGPNEYTFPSDIIFYQKENKIGILDQNKGSIIWFNLDGSALSIDNISREKLILGQAFVWNDQIYHFIHNPKAGKNSYQFNITDINLRKINYSMFKSEPSQISNLNMHPFGIYNNNLTLHIPNDQCIYQIKQKKISKLFYFDFIDKNLPEKLLKKMLSEEQNATQKQIINYNKEIFDFVIVKTVVPLKDFIFLEITHKFQNLCVLINLKDNSSHVFRNNIGRFSLGKYLACQQDKNIVYFEIPTTQIDKYNSRQIKNINIVGKELSKNLMHNNPWILKVQL